MKLSDKQQQIIAYLRTSGTITKKHAVLMLEDYYYCNAEKYVGEILSNMVKRGMLIRIKPGIFVLGQRKTSTPIDKNQLPLL